MHCGLARLLVDDAFTLVGDCATLSDDNKLFDELNPA